MLNDTRKDREAGLTKGGWSMFGTGAKVGAGLVCAAVIALLPVVSTSAQSKDKDMSDRSVKVFMRFAWELVPEKYTPSSGRTILVDKKKPNASMVPIDVAREVIKVGYLSGHAQLCDLMEEQKANFETMMRRQQAAKTWSDQQMLFIQKLHQVTTMLMAGKIVIIEKEGEQVVSEREAKTNIKEPCTDAKRQSVKAAIVKYIDASAPKTAQPAKKK